MKQTMTTTIETRGESIFSHVPHTPLPKENIQTYTKPYTKVNELSVIVSTFNHFSIVGKMSGAREK